MEVMSDDIPSMLHDILNKSHSKALKANGGRATKENTVPLPDPFNQIKTKSGADNLAQIRFQMHTGEFLLFVSNAFLPEHMLRFILHSS
jgi:hypothetical protein